MADSYSVVKTLLINTVAFDSSLAILFNSSSVKFSGTCIWPIKAMLTLGFSLIYLLFFLLGQNENINYPHPLLLIKAGQRVCFSSSTIERTPYFDLSIILDRILCPFLYLFSSILRTSFCYFTSRRAYPCSRQC